MMFSNQTLSPNYLLFAQVSPLTFTEGPITSLINDFPASPESPKQLDQVSLVHMARFYHRQSEASRKV